MTIIYKYRISNFGNTILSAPIIKPLKIDYQDENPFLWAFVDTEKLPEEWAVTKIGTGWDIDEINNCNPVSNATIELDCYLNTTFEPGTPYVWHWFCRPLIQSMDL